MPVDIFNLGKQAVRKLLPTSANNILSQLDSFGINLGLGTSLPIKDPMRAYMWEVEFRDNGGRGQYITHYAKNTAIPSSTNEQLKRWYCGVEYTYSGRDTSPRVFRVTFWDNQNLDSYRYFQYWYDVMNQGKTNRKANPVNYNREVILKLKDSSDVQDLFTIQMEEVYPIEIGEVALSYAENGEFTFDVMFSFRRKTIL